MASRYRILVIECLPTVSGGQRVLLESIPALSAFADLIALLPGEGPLKEALSSWGIPCYHAPMGEYTLVRKNVLDVANFTARTLWLTVTTWRLVTRKDVDLIYANSGRAFVWGTLAATLSRRPIIWHHHNLLADRKTIGLLRILGKTAAVKQLICASEAACQQFPGLTRKSATIPSGVDLERYFPDQEAGKAIRQKLGLQPGDRLAAIVGDLIPLKGQDTLLEAARSVPDNIHFLLVGDPRPDDHVSLEYQQHLRCEAPSNVTFTGRSEGIPEILNGIDVLVVASERETGPLVMLEALACGVPVISTPVGQASRLLPPDALFPIGDSRVLSDRLCYWLGNDERLEAARITARGIAERKLSLETFRDRIGATVWEVISGSPDSHQKDFESK